MKQLLSAMAFIGLVLSGCSGSAENVPAVVMGPGAPPPATSPPDNNPTPPAPTPTPGQPPIAAFKPQWAALSEAKLQPGSLLLPSGCTAGFLFVDPVLRAYYVGTAAHCTDSADGTTQDGTGTRISVEFEEVDLGEIGTVVFDSDGPVPVSDDIVQNTPLADFSLIQLDEGFSRIANPQMISFDGPKGFVTCNETSPGDLVGVYGNGTLFLTLGTLQSRQALLLRCNPGSTVVSNTPASPGDSGGPLLHVPSGKALGHMVGTDFATTTSISIEHVFSALAEAGFGNVALATVDGGYASPGKTVSP